MSKQRKFGIQRKFNTTISTSHAQNEDIANFHLQCSKSLPSGLFIGRGYRGNLSAPNHKSQLDSEFKSRSPNRKNFPQIAVSGSSNRTFKSRDL